MGRASLESNRAREPGRLRQWLVLALAAVVPPLIAFGIEDFVWPSVTRWLLFNAAVIASSWLGGLKSGLAATALSTMLVFEFFLPPAQSLGRASYRSYVTAGLFVVIGVAISAFHERLRRARQAAAVALAESRRATADLGRARAALEAANLRLRHTSRDLYESKQLLQAVFDHSPNAIVIKGLDGSFLLSNRRFQQILGRTAADLMGKTDFDVLPPDEAKKHLAVDAAAIKAGGAVQYEEAGNVQGQNHAFLETIFPLRDESGKAFGVCWIGTEITEIKHAEDALARTAAELTEAQRVAHIGSWMFDLDTEFMTWSEELYRIHGLDPSHPAPKHREEYQRLFPPQSRAALSAATERLKRDRVPYELEVETILPDGSTRWISVRGEPMADASGRLVAVRGTAQDVTQLKQLQRMKEEWMSVIGHDLRQPVGIIKMSVELLPELHVGEINARERETTERIRAAANGIARMIDDLLDMSRIEAHRLSLERVWMDPCPLVRHTVSSLAHITGDRTVEVTDDASVSKVFVDLMRFEQVLGNLLSNAVKYGDKGAAIHVHVAQHGHDVEISVSNHGPGLTRDDVSRLFSRFGRVSTSHVSGIQGLGLGLYIANGLVEAHGGHMWVDSVPGQTTTFHFTLPSRVASDIAA